MYSLFDDWASWVDRQLYYNRRHRVNCLVPNASYWIFRQSTVSRVELLGTLVVRLTRDFLVLELEGEIRDTLNVSIARLARLTDKSSDRRTQKIVVQLGRILRSRAQAHEKTDDHGHEATYHAVPQVADLFGKKEKRVNRLQLKKVN